MFGAIEKSAVLMVIMGRNWPGATDDQGVRLIDKPQYFVRREILLAHELNKKIITVRLAWTGHRARSAGLPDLGSRQSGAPTDRAGRRTYIINGN